MMWILLHDPLVQPRPGFVPTNLRWRSIASLPGPKKWPGKWTKIYFCFSWECCESWDTSYHRYSGVWKKVQVIAEDKSALSVSVYFLLATQMIPLVKERFLTFPPLSPKPHSCPTPLIHLSVLALFPVLMSWGQIAVMELLSCSQPISNSAFSSDLVANNLPDSLSMLSQFLELVKVKYESPF